MSRKVGDEQGRNWNGWEAAEWPGRTGEEPEGIGKTGMAGDGREREKRAHGC